MVLTRVGRVRVTKVSLDAGFEGCGCLCPGFVGFFRTCWVAGLWVEYVSPGLNL